MSRTSYTKDFKRFIISLGVTGIALNAVARWYGVKIDRITEWKRKCIYNVDEFRILDMEKDIINMYNSGIALNDIANNYNIHYNIVHYLIFKEYLDCKYDTLRNNNGVVIDRVKKEYLSGKTMQEVSDITGVSPATICKILNQDKLVRKPWYDDEKRDEVIRLYEKNEYTLEYISKISNRSVSCILDIINKYKPDIRRRKDIREYTDDEHNTIYDLYVNSGLTPLQIENQIDISRKYINYYIRKLGLSRDRSAGQRGKRGSNYKHGMSNYPYCELFDNGLKERVISFWGYKCVMCGKEELECNERLHVHHVLGDVMTCCNETERLFVPLCRRCHGKTFGKHVVEMRTKEMIKYIYNIHRDGKCYYSEKEYYDLFDISPYINYLRHAEEVRLMKLKRKDVIPAT